jgi:cell division protein ZapA (FtsZ GTPase activity inhibitor)
MTENSEDIININVLIADRPYPLKIKRNEEENVRKAARDINEKVKQFQQAYAAKDKQDYLAMCTMMYAVELMSYKQKTIINNDEEFELELRKIEDTLAQAEHIL